MDIYRDETVLGVTLFSLLSNPFCCLWKHPLHNQTQLISLLQVHVLHEWKHGAITFSFASHWLLWPGQSKWGNHPYHLSLSSAHRYPVVTWTGGLGNAPKHEMNGLIISPHCILWGYQQVASHNKNIHLYHIVQECYIWRACHTGLCAVSVFFFLFFCILLCRSWRCLHLLPLKYAAVAAS